MSGAKRNADLSRTEAKQALQYYLRTAYVRAGINWTTDNSAEVDGIVDAIINAAVCEVRHEMQASV